MKCAHCTNTRLHSVGDLFCSRQDMDMDSLGNGALVKNATAGNEEIWHTTRLSVRCVYNGSMQFTTPERTILLNKRSFLLLNDGQSYCSSPLTTGNAQLLTIAFQKKWASEAAELYRFTPEWILDNTGNSKLPPMIFYEKAYENAEIKNIADSIHALLLNNISPLPVLALDSAVAGLLYRLIPENAQVAQHIQQLSAIRTNTRTEIYRRLCLAKEYMDVYYKEKLTLEQLSGICLLSVPAFKKYFSECYHISPYQYILDLRLRQFSEKLANSSLPLHELCRQYGFNDHSSFTRLFRARFGCTPTAYRQQKISF